MTGEPAEVPGLSWRASRAEDRGALEGVQRAAQTPPGPVHHYALTDLSDIFDPELAPSTVVGVNESGDLAAYAFVFQHTVPRSHRIYLDARVVPSMPAGVEETLLDWCEREAAQRVHSLSVDRPVIARIDFSDAREVSVGLYRQRDYSLALEEDTMVHSLHERFARDVVDDLEVVPWSEAIAHLFYQVYVEAFRTRPGFPGWSEREWTAALAGRSGFRADLSTLALLRADPIGFVMCSVRESSTGWIDQIGVTPGVRGRGIAGTLLVRTLEAFREVGLHQAGLEVNTNNDTARRVYQRVGFQDAARRRVYEKLLRS